MTSMDLQADIQQLADLHRDCMAKAEDFVAETKSRGEEFKALAEAKRVIKEATGGAKKLRTSRLRSHSPTLAPCFYRRFGAHRSSEVCEGARAQTICQTLSTRGAHDIGDAFWLWGPL